MKHPHIDWVPAPEEVRAGLEAMIAELAKARETAERWKQAWQRERLRAEALMKELEKHAPFLRN